MDHDGTQRSRLGKVFHLNEANEHLGPETRNNSEGATRVGDSESLQKTCFPKYPPGQAETMSKTQNEATSLASSGKDNRQTETNIVPSLAEIVPQYDAKDGHSSYFILWRKHLLGTEEPEEPENLIPEQSSPGEKLSLNPASAPKNQEDQSVNENMPVKEENLLTRFANVETAAENICTLLGEVKHTVEHADHSMRAFKETFGIFKECCDNMCMSMSNLQGVLEILITILRE